MRPENEYGEGVGSYIRSDSNAEILHITIAVVLAIAHNSLC